MSTEGIFTLTTDVIKKYIENSLSSSFNKILSLHYGSGKTHEQKVNKITDWYRTQRLVMVLGAGTSVSYGLPDWNTLLQKLLLITIEPDDDKNNIEKAGVLAKTFTNIFEPNSLISARYLNNYFKKTKPDSKLAFETAIRDVLYIGVKTNEDSALLKEIRQFCT
ncbi:SIR2 family protein [Aeromonas caviae]|uniref:hypothetical protein n=1 Tax=Aeromonas caviae TaxID=648 RepID=UPI002B474D99|nr:hypothetical protein [Aeromonas caviae]